MCYKWTALVLSNPQKCFAFAGLQIRMRNQKFICYFSTNIGCGYSKECFNERVLLSVQNMLNLFGNKITILRSFFFLTNELENNHSVTNRPSSTVGNKSDSQV